MFGNIQACTIIFKGGQSCTYNRFQIHRKVLTEMKVSAYELRSHFTYYSNIVPIIVPIIVTLLFMCDG